MNKILPRDKWKRVLISKLKIGAWFCRDKSIDDSIYMNLGRDPTFPPTIAAVVIEGGWESKTCIHSKAGQNYNFYGSEKVWDIDSGADLLEHKN